MGLDFFKLSRLHDLRISCVTQNTGRTDCVSKHQKEFDKKPKLEKLPAHVGFIVNCLTVFCETPGEFLKRKYANGVLPKNANSIS